ncbi:PAS domain-containing protein [Bacillus paranthracis]
MKKGRGLVINPAYTKLTGLTEEDIIGKPATTDIVEGESMHMKVLRTRRGGTRHTYENRTKKARCNCKRSTSYCGWNIERERRCNSRRIRNSKINK